MLLKADTVLRVLPVMLSRGEKIRDLTLTKDTRGDIRQTLFLV